MVIDRTASGFSPWDETEHRRLSRGALFTIVLVGAVHVVGALYLYQLHTAMPKPTSDPSDFVIQSISLPKDPPKPPVARPMVKVVHIHNTPIPTIKPTTTIDALPQPPRVEIETKGPPTLPTTLNPPDLAGLPSTSTPQSKVIHDPTWLARPTNAQLVDFYPPRALDQEVPGQATLDCLVTANGQLTRCTVSGETPKGQGFAEAALKAARIFRMSPKTEDGQPVEGGTVHVPMRFAVQ